MNIAIVTGIILSLSLIATNWMRARRRLRNIDLLPNCLLTRYPLVFIGGKKTPFYFLSYWNQIPTYLREHGYEVIEINLPWRNTEVRTSSLLMQLKRLSKAHKRLHLIADTSSETELKSVCQQQPDFIQSYSLTTAKDRNNIETTNKLCVEQLKPGFKSIQNLRIHTYPAEQWKTLPSPQWLVVGFHNLALFPEKGLSPSTVGLFGTGSSLQIQNQYLNLANKLGEQDF